MITKYNKKQRLYKYYLNKKQIIIFSRNANIHLQNLKDKNSANTP